MPRRTEPGGIGRAVRPFPGHWSVAGPDGPRSEPSGPGPGGRPV